MATYQSLTIEQQRLLQSFTNTLRAWAGEQARVNNHGAVLDTDYTAQASAIINSLTAGEIIPNTSGLDGAAGIAKEDLISVVAHVQGILAGFNMAGHRQLWVKLAGAHNMIG